MERRSSVLEAQVDWITIASHGARRSAPVVARAQTMMRSERVLGNRELPFRLERYVGTRCGRVRLGGYESSAIVQLSGDLAALHFDWFIGQADSITRVDLACTAILETYDSDVAQDGYIAALTHRLDHPRSAAASLVLGSDGGATLYLGKRTSDRYFRCYNKQTECEASDDTAGAERYARAWRYEIEFHDDAASAIAHALPPREHRPGWITTYIHKYCSDHGIVPRFDAHDRPVHVGGFRRRSDRESRLDWLSRSVAPTIAWLNQSTPRAELLNRLGLADTNGGDSEHVDA